MKRKILYITIIALLLCNALILLLYHKQSETIEKCSATYKKYRVEINDLKTNLLYNMMSGNVDLSELCISDTHFIDTQFKDIFESDDDVIVVCRISEQYCSSCNAYVIMLTKQFENAHSIFLTNNASRRGFQNIKDTYSLLDNEIYGCSNIALDAEQITFPYIIIAKDKGRNAQVIIPFENCLELDSAIVSAVMKI